MNPFSLPNPVPRQVFDIDTTALPSSDILSILPENVKVVKPWKL